ncbi:hypothetical protein KKD52_10845 [Myxococcota bacterium]|nr:hypothetical protein [Myxococcota bacterium]MBU1410066.1 hypothetical protein [Myxococcota bacterium]MBU1510848.1 hypothetical protein [Myxococcota bacterium]
MKHRTIALFFVAALSCCNRPSAEMAHPSPNVVNPSPGSGYVPPATTQGKDGWVMYVNAKTWTPANVKDFRPGFATPEAALLHFYASKMRGDEDWKQALVNESIPNWDRVFTVEMFKRLQDKLDRSKNWIYFEVSLVGKMENGDKLYIKVREKIGFEGRIESGTDDATLMKIGDRWVVVSIPT